MTQKDVEDMFARYGRIINSRVLVDQASGGAGDGITESQLCSIHSSAYVLGCSNLPFIIFL